MGCPFDAFWFHSIKGKIIAPISFLIHRYIISNSKNVVYVTKSFLQKRYPNKHNNTFISDVEYFNPNGYRYNPTEKIVLATIGSIDIKYKGQDTVFKAINYLSEKGYHIEYRLIGPGSKDYLLSLAKKLNIVSYVKFIGALPHEKIPKHLENVTYYVQPSLTEGLPRSILEVESLGIPVISTNVGGMIDIVNKQAQFKRKNYKALAAIIEDNLNSLDLLSNYSLEISRLFNKNTMTNKLYRFYNESYERSNLI